MSPVSQNSNLSAQDAIGGRRSIRRFRPDGIPDGTIEEILAKASRSPTNMNAQPWLIHVVLGDVRKRLSIAMRRAIEDGEACPEFRYAPETAKEPYLARKRKLGYDLYALYGIARDDKAARKEAFLRNYDFFGAPCGLFFTMDRYMELGSWLDCGMFMQSVMLLARSYGLETCAQQAWCDLGGIVHRELGIPDEQIILSGMSIGYPDLLAPENTLISERADVGSFATWHQ